MTCLAKKKRTYTTEVDRALDRFNEKTKGDYTPTLDDYKKFNTLSQYPQKAFQMSLLEKTSSFKPLKGQILLANFGATVGSVLEGVHFCVVINVHGKKASTILVAPIMQRKKRTPQHVAISEEAYTSDFRTFSGFICTEKLQTISIGTLIPTNNDDQNYCHGELTPFGSWLVEKAMLETMGLSHLAKGLQFKNETLKTPDQTSFPIYEPKKKEKEELSKKKKSSANKKKKKRKARKRR